MSLRHGQSGLTLIELMIALVIGLLIIAGVGEVFLAGRASYSVQQRLSDLQENGRFALHFLQSDIRRAGYPNSNTGIDAFSTKTPAASCPPKVISDSWTCDGGGNAPDMISISYEGGRDCLGQKVPGLVINTYYVDAPKDRLKGQTFGSLMCHGNGGPRGQPLVSGIENMQILYGEDTDSNGYANRYVRADEVSNWANVVSVRIAVLASTVDAVAGDDPGDSRTYRLLDASATTPLPARVRARVFQTTVEVRNRTP
ncbi:MAG: PilW family protein [Stenotrophobium sp.]